MIFTVEKTLKDNSDKVPADLKSSLEDALKDAKQKLPSEDIEVLKKARTELETKSHKLAEIIYQQQTAGAGANANGQSSSNAGSNNNSKSDKDNVVDAEFEDK